MFVRRPDGSFNIEKRLSIAVDELERIVLREVILQRARFDSIGFRVALS
jgi:hypothetical protein